MSEFKTLLHHALSAMFAVLILGAVGALISLGHMMWNAFAEQDAANYRLREYSMYSAFDGTTVRGQEVISLLHQTQGSPWVIITDKDLEPICVIFNKSDLGYKFDVTTLPPGTSGNLHTAYSKLCTESYVNLEKTVKKVGNITEIKDEKTSPTDSGNIIFNFSTASSKPDYSSMQEWFLSRGAKIGSAGYLPYESYLIYEDNYSTDIAGIILVEVLNTTGG